MPTTDQTEAARILEHSAPQLFIARAKELGAEFAPEAMSLSAIAAICRHLDGIPRAIEFAAARAATLGIEQVASGLQEHFKLLTSGRHTALPRQRTLRATLDWSYQLLSSAERELVDCVAIFAGPFSLDAVRAVTAEKMEASEIVDCVADLVGKSLVIRTADQAGAGFRLLETTRVRALDRLNERISPAADAHRRYRRSVDLANSAGYNPRQQ